MATHIANGYGLIVLSALIATLVAAVGTGAGAAAAGQHGECHGQTEQQSDRLFHVFLPFFSLKWIFTARPPPRRVNFVIFSVIRLLQPDNLVNIAQLSNFLSF